MKNLPKVKLGKVGVGSNIAQKITRQAHRKSYLIIICPQFTWKVEQKWNYVKLKSVRTLLRITRLANRKSYLIIICPNAHEKLTKSEIMWSWSQFEHFSESLVYPIGIYIWPQFTWKVRSSYYLLQLGLIYPYLAPKYHVSPYLALLTCIYHYLPIFCLI